MIQAIAINIQPTKQSRLPEVDFDKLSFGRTFSDHMLVIDYENGEWQTPHIVPYAPLLLSPANSALHYGQALFEGMKCDLDPQTGELLILRPHDNARRLNVSAERLGMPTIPEELFLESLYELLRLDRNWVPTRPDHSLYIRPFMFATDELLGVRPSDTYKFMIITSPVGPYYSRPLNVLVADQYVRAFPGGTGYAKAAGNYAASMYPMMLAKQKGYDQVLWTDGFTHEYLEEIGTMNVFFVIDGEVHTPELDGTILDGITRNSIITLLRDSGLSVSERKINIHEILAAHANGTLQEAFGAGTAATVTHIAGIGYKDKHIELTHANNRPVSELARQQLVDIKRGIARDPYNWVVRL